MSDQARALVGALIMAVGTEDFARALKDTSPQRLNRLAQATERARTALDEFIANLEARDLIALQMSNVIYNCGQGAGNWEQGKPKLLELLEQYDQVRRGGRR